MRPGNNTMRLVMQSGNGGASVTIAHYSTQETRYNRDSDKTTIQQVGDSALHPDQMGCVGGQSTGHNSRAHSSSSSKDSYSKSDTPPARVTATGITRLLISASLEPLLLLLRTIPV